MLHFVQWILKLDGIPMTQTHTIRLACPAFTSGKKEEEVEGNKLLTPTQWILRLTEDRSLNAVFLYIYLQMCDKKYLKYLLLNVTV